MQDIAITMNSIWKTLKDSGHHGKSWTTHRVKLEFKNLLFFEFLRTNCPDKVTQGIITTVLQLR